MGTLVWDVEAAAAGPNALFHWLSLPSVLFGDIERDTYAKMGVGFHSCPIFICLAAIGTVCCWLLVIIGIEPDIKRLSLESSNVRLDDDIGGVMGVA